jgi:hypothetical protein
MASKKKEEGYSEISTSAVSVSKTNLFDTRANDANPNVVKQPSI